MVYKSRLPVIKNGTEIGVIANLSKENFPEAIIQYEALLKRDNPYLVGYLDTLVKCMGNNNRDRNRSKELILLLLYSIDNQADEMSARLPQLPPLEL